MKKQLIIVSILGLLGTSGAIIASSANKVLKGAEAYNAETSLPTTIDLNDSSDSEIRNYYSSLNNLSSNELKGTNLLKNLKPILKNNQTTYSYDYSNGTVIWQLYEIIDRDWEKSPADHLIYGTYDSSTNKIYNYQYGTSNSNTKNNPYIHALYTNRNVDNQSRAWGDHSQDGWGINREHVWAKSHGMGSTDSSSNSGGARGDPMHLWAGNGFVNGKDYRYHNNNFFGFVNTNDSYIDAGDTYSYLRGNLEGKSASLGTTRTIFEPQDSDKGDIARICFYMAARYNYLSGSDSDGIDANNPWCTLYDGTSDPNGNASYDSTEYQQCYMGILRDLLAWNRLDPPDEWEIHRNNLLFKNYTHNRNPFVDFPEWAEYIWGRSTMDGNQRSVISYSSTPTGNANPTSDNIASFDTSHDVPVTSVTVSPATLSLEAGHSQLLSTTVLPSNATYMNLTWTSSNSGVASVSGGVVSAHVAGNTIIRATAHNGVYGECEVTVTGGSGDQTVTQFELATDGVKPGDEVIIAAQSSWDSTVAYAVTKQTISTYYLAANVESVNNRVLTRSDSTPIWTVGGSASALTFENDGDYLYGKKNGSYNNIFANGTSSTENNTWWVSNNGSNNGFNMYSPENVYIQYSLYNSTHEFKGATGPNSSMPINFYRKVTKTIHTYTSEEFATDFLSSITCNNNGETAPTLSRSWSELESLYNELDSNHKAALRYATANESGTTVEQAMARYDLLCRKYSQFYNFINRSSANPSESVLTKMIRKDNSLALAFSIVSGVIVIGAIVLITLKKKKVI